MPWRNYVYFTVTVCRVVAVCVWARRYLWTFQDVDNDEGTGSHLCQYRNCGFRFLHKRSLDRHQRQKHGALFGVAHQMAFFCGVEDCQRVFYAKSRLTAHQKTVHGISAADELPWMPASVDHWRWSVWPPARPSQVTGFRINFAFNQNSVVLSGSVSNTARAAWFYKFHFFSVSTACICRDGGCVQNGWQHTGWGQVWLRPKSKTKVLHFGLSPPQKNFGIRPSSAGLWS